MPRDKRVISAKDFARDLGRGALGEDIAEAFFRDEFGVVAKNVSENNPDYDMILCDIVPELKKSRKVQPKKLLKKVFRDSFGYSKKDEITVEVKYDEAAARYKNIFVEIFFNIETGSPGTMFKCKADLLVWVVPQRKKFTIYIIKRAEFLAWLLDHVYSSDKKLKYKIPGISPYARGLAVSMDTVAESKACVGVFDFKI